MPVSIPFFPAPFTSPWRWRQQGPLKHCILPQYYMVSQPEDLELNYLVCESSCIDILDPQQCYMNHSCSLVTDSVIFSILLAELIWYLKNTDWLSSIWYWCVAGVNWICYCWLIVALWHAFCFPLRWWVWSVLHRSVLRWFSFATRSAGLKNMCAGTWSCQWTVRSVEASPWHLPATASPPAALVSS
jgi:hypothetical protein